jgi:hypothetical protein
VLDGFEAAGLEPCVYVHGGTAEVWLSERPSTHPGHVRALAASAGVGDLRAVVAAEVVLAFSIIGAPHGSLVPVAEALAGVAEVHLDRALEYPRMAAITVAPRGRSKWDGVVAYCNAHGIDTTRILALGDGPNDVELLERAAISLVPENGHPSAQAHATHLIGSPSSGGWAAVLDHLG